MTAATLGSVANAARLLKSFSSTQREWGVSDLARSLSLGKSTVHRLLATLVAEGMIDQDARSGRYRLGLVMFDLAAAVRTQYDLHEALLTPMTELRNRSGETVQVAVLDGRQVVYIERLDSPNTLRIFLEIGRRNWAHCSGTGKVLLAHIPQRELDRLLDGWVLESRTAHTITSISVLRKALEAVRAQGFAENRHESELGVVSWSAPVRDASGAVVAALSVAGPADRMDSDRHDLVQATIAAAAQVSRRLGYRATR